MVNTMNSYRLWSVFSLVGVLLSTLCAVQNPAFANPLVAQTVPELEPVNFEELEAALREENWQLANDVTRQFVLSAIFPPGYDPVQPEQISCETLQVLDGMWRQYSGGQFGFSVQGQLAPSVANATTHRDWVNQWGDRLGWYEPTTPVERSAQWQVRESFPWKLSDQINYSTTAPQGHLPWIGEDATRIIALSTADKATCGVCAYEAFYLQSERYYEYFPALLRRLQTCQILTD